VDLLRLSYKLITTARLSIGITLEPLLLPTIDRRSRVLRLPSSAFTLQATKAGHGGLGVRLRQTVALSRSFCTGLAQLGPAVVTMIER